MAIWSADFNDYVFEQIIASIYRIVDFLISPLVKVQEAYAIGKY